MRLSGGPPARPEDRWDVLVDAVYRRPPFAVLFRLERLAHDLTQALWDRGGPPADLLRGPQAAVLPERSLLMLHAGMGLAFSERLIGALVRGAGEAEVAAALAAFDLLCRGNARPGYAPTVWEPLGLIVRLFHPRWTAAVDGVLAGYESDARLFFWHGVGRAIYFLPRYFWPGATRRALARCRREPPAGEARTDALAGFVFAAAMVNLRQPPVLERLLALFGERPEEGAVVAGAFAACVLARRRTTPDDPAITALLAHQPAPDAAATWRRVVQEPIATALEVYYPCLVASGRLPQLARHQDLAALVATEAVAP